MKFTAVTVACLASGVYAEAPSRVYARDAAVVSSAINAVGSNIAGVDTAVQGFNGKPDDVVSSSNSLIQALKDGQSKVAGSASLTLTDSLGLQDLVKGLTTKADSLVSDLKAKKDAIEKAGLCSETQSIIKSINDGSNSFIEAVVGKVPTEAQSIATSLVAPLKKDLSDAQSAYSDCQNSGGSSSSSAPASGSTSASAPASTGGSGSSTSAASAPASTGGSGSSTYVAPTGTGIVTSAQPTGTGAPTKAPTATGPVITAGAALIAPAGALAMAVAALMV